MLHREDEYRREDTISYRHFHDHNLLSFYRYSGNHWTRGQTDEVQEKLQQPFKAEKNDFKYIVKTLSLFASLLTLLGFALSYQANGLFHTSQDLSSFSVKKSIPINNR